MGSIWWNVFCRQKSDGILAEAESVRKALEEARQAQEKAKQSIEEANGDIGTIDKDLNEVSGYDDLSFPFLKHFLFFIRSTTAPRRRRATPVRPLRASKG